MGNTDREYCYSMLIEKNVGPNVDGAPVVVCKCFTIVLYRLEFTYCVVDRQIMTDNYDTLLVVQASGLL